MKIRILGMILVLAIFSFSCQETDNFNSDASELMLKSADIATSDITVEGVLEELNYEADFFAESEHLLRELAHYRGHGHDLLRGSHCDRYAEQESLDVSIDTAETGYPIVITIDYGDSTILHHGTVVSGLVSIEISAPRGTDGATRTFSYEDCVVDSVIVNGTRTEVFMGDSLSRMETNTVDVSSILPDGTELNRTGEKVREWTSGLDTPMVHEDDTIKIEGTDYIESSTGDSWSKVITESLVKSGSCRNIVSGVVQYLYNDELIASLDYGDGTCDNVAELTSDGEVIEIELHGFKAKANMDAHHHGDGEHRKGH
ncbi:hypothetical protein ACUNWD_04415 [Sunxiuqinia sp. A32]|uniref:hypothetical protein n=1 Tax=Sunxiuqinia sp. A32 TaxID=3461496 RepID=UPI004045592C